MNPNCTDFQIKAQMTSGLINLKWFVQIPKNKRIIVVCLLAGTQKSTMLIYVINNINVLQFWQIEQIIW